MLPEVFAVDLPTQSSRPLRIARIYCTRDLRFVSEAHGRFFSRSDMGYRLYEGRLE